MAETASASRPSTRSSLSRASPGRLAAKHHLEPNPFEKSFSSSGPSTDVSRSNNGSDRKGADPSRANSVSTPPLNTRPGAAYRDRTLSSSKSQPSPSANTNAADPASTSTPKQPLLPPVASITSPAGETNQYPWAPGLTSSLRAGPLSPAMLTGPQTSTFDPNSFRTGFTPDLSNFKTGLTPLGAGGPMSFPPPSPNTAAFLAAMVNNTTSTTSAATITPNTLAAISGNAHPLQVSSTNNATTQPQDFASKPDTNNAFDFAFSNSLDRESKQQQQANSKLKDSISEGYASSNTASTSVSPQMLQRPLGSTMGNAEQHHQQHQQHQHQQHQHPQQQHHQQQQQQQANQVASGLFLLSQAHQEITKRENGSTSLYDSTPSKNGPLKRGTKGAAGGSATKRKKAATAVENQQLNSNPNSVRKRPRKKDSSQAPEHEIKDPEPPFDSDSDAEGDFHHDHQDGGGDDKEELDEKRKNFLERNRQAALKCRQRKKAWLASLQTKVEYLQTDNENLQNTVAVLRNEVLFLKSQLAQAAAGGGGGGVGGPPQPMPMGIGMGLHMVPQGHPADAHHHTMAQPGMALPAGMAPHPAYLHPAAALHGGSNQPPHQAGAYSAHAVPRPSQMAAGFGGRDHRIRPRSEGGGEGMVEAKMMDQAKHTTSGGGDASKARDLSAAPIKV